MSLVPDAWRLIAAALVDGVLLLPRAGAGRLAATREDPAVGRSIRGVGDPPTIEVVPITLDGPRPNTGIVSIMDWNKLRDLQTGMDDAVEDISALAAVSHAVRDALAPVWPEIYRSVAPCFTIGGTTHRVDRDFRMNLGLDATRKLPDDWYRLRLGLLAQNPTQRLRKTRKSMRARAQVSLGYESRPHAQLKARYGRVRKLLREMEKTSAGHSRHSPSPFLYSSRV